MVDITIVFMELTNQQTALGGHHLVVCVMVHIFSLCQIFRHSGQGSKGPEPFFSVLNGSIIWEILDKKLVYWLTTLGFWEVQLPTHQFRECDLCTSIFLQMQISETAVDPSTTSSRHLDMFFHPRGSIEITDTKLVQLGGSSHGSQLVNCHWTNHC